MTFKRFLLGLKSLGRVAEIGSCLKQSFAPVRETLAFLQVLRLKYPYVLKLRNGVTLELLDWQDLTTAWVVFYGNEYALHSNDRVIIDCGANIGAFSLHCAAALPDARLVAVEPFPANYERLIERVAKNGLSQRTKMINAAVVGVPGTVFMDDGADVASHSRKIGGDHGVEIQGLTLLDIMEAYEIDEVDLLKVDIEGAEYTLIEKTPASVLRRCKRVGMEYHRSGDPEQLFKQFHEAGFVVGRYPKKGKAGVVEFLRK